MTDDFDFGSPAIDPPPHGWDNAQDIAEGKRVCINMGRAINNSKVGKRYCRDIAAELYNRGISPKLAIKLIQQFGQPAAVVNFIDDVVYDTYRDNRFTPPGILSLVRLPELSRPEDDDDLNWLEGGSPTWPAAIPYDDHKQQSAKLAELFLRERPAKLVVSDDVIYSLERGLWREMSERELAAEIRATDPTLTLDQRKI